MHLSNHEARSAIFAMTFAVASGIAFRFFAHASIVATLLAAGVIFGACLVAALANDRDE
jgi:lipoprotein signal peptidase